MKRFVVVFVGTLFILLTGFLAGCGIVPTTSPETHTTNAYGTLTAIVITPSPTATSVPNENAIIQVLNTALENNKVVDDLSKAIDAYYQAMDIRFSKNLAGELTSLQIDMRCICVKNTACCTSERTFVVLANAMKAANKQIIERMPSTIQDVQIWCYNGEQPIGIIMVLWSDLQGYIATDTVGGYQLGSRIMISDAPFLP
jgi:hypothetical protein